MTDSDAIIMNEIREVLANAGRPLTASQIESRCESLDGVRSFLRPLTRLRVAGEVVQICDGEGLYRYQLAGAVPERNPRCHWRVAPTDRPERGGVIWSTECRRQFELLDGKPHDYGMRWCPFCGKDLVHDKLTGLED